MSRHISSTRTFALALALSAAMHAGIGVLLSSRVLLPASVYAEPPAQAPETAPPEFLLGLESSSNQTPNWLGFEEPTPHEASQSTVEQPELTRDPSGQNTLALEDPAPTPADPIQQTASESAQIPEPEAVTPQSAIAAEVVATAEEALQTAADLLATLPAKVIQLAAQAPPTPPSPLPEVPAPAPDPADPASSPGPPTPSFPSPGAPGEASTKDSTATALTKPIDIRPGRPAAAEGLEINTVRARWSITTLLTAEPRNPTLIVTFGRDGRVKRASFALKDGKPLDTGYRDVDEPLLNAVYQWTAVGKALEALPEPMPDEDPATAPGLSITVRIILRG